MRGKRHFHHILTKIPFFRPEFHFIIGSDLLPTLQDWDYGDKLLTEIPFVIFERKGYEKYLDTEYIEKNKY